MKKYLFLILMIVAQFANGQSNILEQYRWENRLILLFGQASDTIVEKQITELEKDSAGITERDLLILHIDRNDVQFLRKPSSPAFSAKQLRNRYDVKRDEFRYILIGKDGGVKYNKKDFVLSEALFSIIDAMPMRKREMREE